MKENKKGQKDERVLGSIKEGRSGCYRAESGDGESESASRNFPHGPVARLCPSNAGSLGSIPGQETRSHMLQLSFLMPQLKDSTCCN